MRAKSAEEETGDRRRDQDDPPAREVVLAALERHEHSLLALAARITGDAERARDVVQEVFLRLCRAKRAEVEDHLAAWLHTVCRNQALDVKRKERRMTELSTTTAPERVDASPTPAQAAERVDEVGTVLGSLARLPERQREALELKFRHGLTYSEIATAMQTSAGNVGWLLHHGLKALRERLGGLALDSHRSTALFNDRGDGSLEGATQ